MKRGAFAMIDALGFNGIWQREKETAVMAKLKELVSLTSRNVASLHDKPNEEPEEVIGTVSGSFTANTMAIGLTTKSNDHVKAIVALLPAEVTPPELTQGIIDRVALAILASIVRDVITTAAAFTPALAFRGCISFGHFEMATNFSLGHAVDDAAEHIDSANGAMIFLAPSANAIAEGSPLHLTEDPLVPCIVPLRGGGNYRSMAVAPFSVDNSDSDREVLIHRLVGSFNAGTLGADVEKQNTERFLRAASAEFQKRREQL